MDLAEAVDLAVVNAEIKMPAAAVHRVVDLRAVVGLRTAAPRAAQASNPA